MKQNGEWYPIKLKISGFYAKIVKEHIYGKNQTIEELPDGSVILSCEMQNKDRIVSFVLSFGDNCDVIEPSLIKKEIEQIALKFINKKALD